MEVLIIDQQAVSRLLPMDACMEAMAEAMAALSRGDALMPLRTVVWLPDHSGALAAMSAALPSSGALGVKVITVFPGNAGSSLDAHQGAILLFEGEHGRLQAIIDATEVTSVRTAAVSGVATRLLAREDAGDLAILGSGTQARTHLEAMLRARTIRRVRVWSRTPAAVERFARAEGARHGIEIQAAASARAAVDGADVICTVTSSSQPILLGEWLAPGAHVNAVGAVGAASRELDTPAILMARVYVDRRESALNEAGEFVQARAEGAIDERHIVGEIGDVLNGAVPGRRSATEVTVFRGVGLAVEDVAAARLVNRLAEERGEGTRVELGGGRLDAS